MSDKLRRMKADPGDKLVEQSCSTCEFNLGVFVPGMAAEKIMIKTHTVCR